MRGLGVAREAGSVELLHRQRLGLEPDDGFYVFRLLEDPALSSSTDHRSFPDVERRTNRL